MEEKEKFSGSRFLREGKPYLEECIKEFEEKVKDGTITNEEIICLTWCRIELIK